MKVLWPLIGLLGGLCAPANARVQVLTLRTRSSSPQPIGTPITWRVTASNSNSGRLTFQFNVAPPHGRFALVKDFNVGQKKGSTWMPPSDFLWTPTGIEGVYRIQVVVKDFVTGDTAMKVAKFRIDPLVTGSSPVVVGTSNALVALLNAPSCAAGSTMRVSFQQQSAATPSMMTNWVPCHPPHTMTFEIAGMYPSTTYNIFPQIDTGGNITNGPTVTYTTGALPAHVNFPASKVLVGPGAGTDTADAVILHSVTRIAGGVFYPDVATDLAGNILWYYRTSSATHANLLTRPLPGGNFFSIEIGPNWDPKVDAAQLLRELDLAGNIVKETNTGVIQQELLALGATDAGPCSAIPTPAPVGAACLGAFHHEAIQTLPNGQIALLADIEKLFPVGTQGDTSGKLVDVVGDMIIVLNSDWQVAWYFDTFEHAGGAPQLDINRPAVLGETCISGFGGCPPLFLLSSQTAPKAHDWLHANTIYYWPQTHDLIWSSRHQDWVMKIDYNDGKGSGNILWRMGLDGDFTFNNLNNDPYPWFSHQHDVGIENDGSGVMTIFDNGNTRVSPLGLGSNCGPADCNSRGMAVNFDETAMTVTPVLSQDLGKFSTAMGSAQLLDNGTYFFVPALVALTVNKMASYSIEVLPTAGTINGTQALNVQSTEVYRTWQMQDMYTPPIT